MKSSNSNRRKKAKLRSKKVKQPKANSTIIKPGSKSSSKYLDKKSFKETVTNSDAIKVATKSKSKSTPSLVKPKSKRQKAVHTVKKISHKRKVSKDMKARKRADHLASLPKSKFKRFFHRLHPKRVLRYWFSRQGLIMGLKLAGLGLLALGVLGFGLFAFYRKDLPKSIADLQACISGQTTEYYDRTGETLLWASKGNVECVPVDLENVSPYLTDAVLAVEDQDFYEHSGFKLSSVVRATVNNVTGGDTQGGSTITQQYVKNAILRNDERLFSRKIKELILSIELERSFTKNEILSAYLNVASFGSVYDGIEAASRGYFDKPASELTLDESALLAAAIPAPSFYWNDVDAHTARQDFVLEQMLAQGKITQEEFDEAVNFDTFSKVVLDRNQYEGIIAPHFVLETEKQLIEEYGEDVRNYGFKVITTLDMDAQKLAEDAIANAIPAIEARGFDNGAAVAVDVETGKVIAHVGSRDFDYPEFGQINTVTTPRDPGSAFKIFDYSSVFTNTNNWGAGSTVYDYRTTFAPGFTPKNYTGRFHGPLSIRYAFGQSFNIPAIKAMYIAGIEETHQLAYDAGLRSGVNCGGYCGLSSAIGSGVELRLDEMTNSYATFSRGGTYMPLAYVETIYDISDNVLRQWEPRPEEDVVDPQVAYLISDILSDSSVRFTQSFNLNNTVAAVKTGTTDFFKNNTIFGYTKKVAFGSWMGHHDIKKSFGESNTTPVKGSIWRDFMNAYHANLSEEDRGRWDRPDGIKSVRIDRNSGYQSNSGSSDIFPSWYVPKVQTERETADIDIVSGKRATECTPARALKTVTGGSILAELDKTDPYYNAWMKPINEALGDVVGGEIPEEVDDLHQCDDKRPTLQITSAPATCESTCVVTVKVKEGTHDLSEVNFSIDGQLLPGGSVKVSGNDTFNFTFSPTSEGTKTLTAEVVDEALYDSSDVRTIQFTNTTGPTLTSASVIGGPVSVSVNFAWSAPASDLELSFGGACSSEDDVELSSTNTSQVVVVADFPRGECSATIDDDTYVPFTLK